MQHLLCGSCIEPPLTMAAKIDKQEKSGSRASWGILRDRKEDSCYAKSCLLTTGGRDSISTFACAILFAHVHTLVFQAKPTWFRSIKRSTRVLSFGVGEAILARTGLCWGWRPIVLNQAFDWTPVLMKGSIHFTGCSRINQALRS